MFGSTLQSMSRHVKTISLLPSSCLCRVSLPGVDENDDTCKCSVKRKTPLTIRVNHKQRSNYTTTFKVLRYWHMRLTLSRLHQEKVASQRQSYLIIAASQEHKPLHKHLCYLLLRKAHSAICRLLRLFFTSWATETDRIGSR